MDLNDIRRKRMRLFSPANDADQPTIYTTPSSYRNNYGTATTPIDLTSPSSSTTALAAKATAAPELIDLTTTMEADEALASHEATAVRRVYHNIMSIKCACCGETSIGGKNELLRQFTFMVKDSRNDSSTVREMKLNEDPNQQPALVGIQLRCLQCEEDTCVGCGQSLRSCTMIGREADGVKVLWHCDAARLAHIWFMLSCYDDQVKHNKPGLHSSAGQQRKKQKRSQVSGVGYGEEGKDWGHQLDNEYDYEEEAMILGIEPYSSYPGVGNTFDGHLLPGPPKNKSLKSKFSKGLKKTFSTLGSLAHPAPKPYSFSGSGHTLGGNASNPMYGVPHGSGPTNSENKFPHTSNPEFEPPPAVSTVQPHPDFQGGRLSSEQIAQVSAEAKARALSAHETIMPHQPSHLKDIKGAPAYDGFFNDNLENVHASQPTAAHSYASNHVPYGVQYDAAHNETHPPAAPAAWLNKPFPPAWGPMYGAASLLPAFQPPGALNSQTAPDPALTDAIARFMPRFGYTPDIDAKFQSYSSGSQLPPPYPSGNWVPPPPLPAAEAPLKGEVPQFSGLSEFEKQFYASQQKNSEVQGQGDDDDGYSSLMKLVPQVDADEGGPWFYGGAYDAHRGYGADKLNEHSTPEWNKPAAPPRKVDPDDDITAKVMSVLTLLLPSAKHDVPNAFDHEPPPVLVSMMLHSSILDKAAELLRNDSLDDVTARGGLYECLLGFVKALGNHPATGEKLVYAERTINQAGHHLMKVSMGEPTRLLHEKIELAAPLASCMTNLHVSAATMIESAKANEEEFKDVESQQMLWLCHAICDTAELLAANASMAAKVQSDTDLAPSDSTPKPSKDIDAWHKDLSMVEVSDETILDHSIYKKEASNMRNPPTGRMRRLIKEVTSLKTSLPPGIFVRYGESRLDVMKILMVGPKGTPYENGLWEFDLCCTFNYPNESPIMTFRTTGDGVTRVNPNLYEDGKVCLSLLGTWEGDPWKPGQSTLLQVLVSIQAMVFCEEPNCNEPGQENTAGTEASKEYNRQVHPRTVKYAMLNWLEGKKNAAFWSDVVDKHFEAHGEEILETVGGWVKDKSSSAMFHGTGWAGRTTGDGAGKTPRASTADSRLVQKLKGSLTQLGL